jgi:hypothetical protein
MLLISEAVGVLANHTGKQLPLGQSSQRNGATLRAVARQTECRFKAASVRGPATEPCG